MLYSTALKIETDKQEKSSPATLAGERYLPWGSGSAQAWKPRLRSLSSSQPKVSELQPARPAASGAHGDPRGDAYQT